MFKEIYVKNFILIDELHLDFHDGFSVFTVETGAGKSLLIDAISLLCGERANAGFVTHDKDYALIEGVFCVSDQHPILTMCNELDIEIDDELIVTRKITADGKSSVKINGRSVSLSILKNMMQQLIDIHSQHDTQYLLNSRYHLSLLDEYLHENELQAACKQKYEVYDTIKKELDDCLNHEYNDLDLDFLKYQVNEIEKAHLSQEQFDTYQKELKQINNFEKLNDRLNRSYECICGSQKTLENLYEAIHLLNDLQEFEWVDKLNEKLNNCYFEIEEAASLINNQLDHLEFDENHLNEINEYLYVVANLKRKYGNSISAILEKKEEFQERINKIENRQEVIDQLTSKMNQAYDDFKKTAVQLSLLRKKKAKELEKEIIQECKDLYLEKTCFEVRFDETSPSSKGIDKVEFYISMNPGEPLKPLSSVASGGELSRVMLGLKTVFSDLTSIETLIFDEIDTGVSGKVALAIGKKMSQISKRHQLFAITHLASVAACAKAHFIVEKTQNVSTTNTIIRQLQHQEIISELAMMSSNSLSQTALSAAEELYEIAQNQG